MMYSSIDITLRFWSDANCQHYNEFIVIYFVDNESRQKRCSSKTINNAIVRIKIKKTKRNSSKYRVTRYLLIIDICLLVVHLLMLR